MSQPTGAADQTGLSVSVVIPVFNAERWIGAAIDSVIAQSYPVREIVTVDDGSSDGSATVLEGREEIRLIRQVNAGPAAARNRAIVETTGDVIAFIDADDLWPEDKLAIQVGHLRDNPGVGVVLGCQRLLVEEGAELPDWATSQPEWLEGLMDEFQVPEVAAFTMVVRRSVFERIGLYDERLRLSEDVDWLLRAKEEGVEIAVLTDHVLTRRIHGANVTNETAALQRSLFDVLKARIDRTRQRQAQAD